MFRKRHNTHDSQEEAVKHEEKVKQLRNAIGPLSERELKYCTDACLRRYLEARNWNVEKSKKMLQETLKWRSTFKPEDIRWPEVSIESETGKMYRADFQDREGRTVIVMRPAKENTNSYVGQLKYLVYLLENATMNLPDGQEQIIWLIDFTGWGLRNSTPIKTTQETANILQNHYPERLAAGFLFNPPRLFEAFWKVVKYFLDPKTSQKVNFVYLKNEESMELIRKNIDMDVLPEEFGGKAKSCYNHEEFSKMMLMDDVKTAKFWSMDGEPGEPDHLDNGKSHP